MSEGASPASRTGTALAVLLFALGAVAFYFLATYEDAPVDPDWAVEGSSNVPPGSVTVRYTGTATLVFSDGETTWMTDGWFTRLGPLELAAGTIEPDLDAIERGLARNEVESAAAVFPVHSHYDHAMDAPEVARRTGAVLLGSESTSNIGRGWGLPEDQIRTVVNREQIRLGKFTLTPIESRHFEFPDPAVRERALGDPKISEPLVPPVGAFEYKLGKAYALYVSHPKGSWLIQGSAGFREGDLKGIDVDVVFLGVGGLGSQTETYREQYWKETVEYTKAERVIPIHWDSLTGPNEGPFTGSVRALAFLGGGGAQTLEFLQAKEAANPRIEISTLPRYDEVVLF
ncbi:MAG: MBL fold metallo-hydrolase [Myxococcota bacterium]|nr:MBL fold metallo-hydrolase [Myxococcota bacterium]